MKVEVVIGQRGGGAPTVRAPPPVRAGGDALVGIIEPSQELEQLLLCHGVDGQVVSVVLRQLLQRCPGCVPDPNVARLQQCLHAQDQLHDLRLVVHVLRNLRYERDGGGDLLPPGWLEEAG